MPRISIILPVFNGEAFLAECVDSVLAQNLEDFELLAGDDGSSDRSRDILARYCDPRVKVCLNERNVGLFANLNRLTVRATAPLVRFLCQDDALEPGCLAHEVASMDADEKIVMTICSVYEIDSQSRVTGGWDTTGGPIVFDSARCVQRLFYEGCIAGTLSTVCVRRSVLEAAGPFNETYEVSGDYEMWVRVCRHGSVSELRTRLIRLRRHGGRLSMAPFSGVKCVRENRRVIEQIIPLLPARTRSGAQRYFWWKQNVFDTHHFVRCLFSVRLGECRELMKILGARYLIPGLTAWLITLNGRLYKPKPPYDGEPI